MYKKFSPKTNNFFSPPTTDQTINLGKYSIREMLAGGVFAPYTREYLPGADIPTFVAGSGRRNFVYVEETLNPDRWVVLYQSSNGTDGKEQGSWYVTGGYTDDWVIKVDPEIGYGSCGRPDLEELVTEMNKILPHTQADTYRWVHELTGVSLDDIDDKLPMFTLIFKNMSMDDKAYLWKKYSLTPIWGERVKEPPKPIYFIGDVHSRPELVRAALDMAKGNKIIFLGDIFDGPGGAHGSVECLRLIKNAANADLILGNHEAYPIMCGMGSADPPDINKLSLLWGIDPKSSEAQRVYREWMGIKSLLELKERTWLMRCPFYIQGDGWIAAHAKVPNGPLPSYRLRDTFFGTPERQAQIEMLDNTAPLYPGHFWAQDYDGRHGFAIVGHTRLPKVGEFAWDNCILLDWDAKNAGTAAYAIWFDGKIVEVGGLTPYGRTPNPRKPLMPEQRADRNEQERKRWASLTPEQKADATEKQRQRRAARTPEQREAFNERQRQSRASMTPEQREAIAERERRRYLSMTPEQKAARSEHKRQRYHSMTPEEKEAYKELQRQRYHAMTPEQKAAALERERRRYRSMTPEQRAAYYERKRNRRALIRERLERARLGVLAYFTRKEIAELLEEERARRESMTEEEKAIERDFFRDILNTIGSVSPNFDLRDSLREEELRAIAAFIASQRGTRYETMMEDEEVEEAEMLEEGDFDSEDDSREPNPGMSSETVSGVRQKLDDVIYIADSYLDRIGAGQIESVWLIGSRASGEEGPDSDWDFLIVGYGFDDVETEKLDTLECGGRIYGIALDAPTHLRHDFKDIIFCDNEPSEGVKLWDKSRGHTDLSRESNPKRTAALRTDEVLWKKIVKRVTAGNKGGHPGQWSARKAQLAVKLYKEAGGGYIGPKSKGNALDKWTREDWRTKSGRPSLETGERYLPAKAIKSLSAREYARTTEEKRKGLRRGQQFVPQPKEIAAKTAKYRRNNPDDYDFED